MRTTTTQQTALGYEPTVAYGYNGDDAYNKKQQPFYGTPLLLSPMQGIAGV